MIFSACCTNCPEDFKLDTTFLNGKIIELADSENRMGLIRIYPNKNTGYHTMHAVPYYYQPSYSNLNCNQDVKFNLAHSNKHHISLAKNISKHQLSLSEKYNQNRYNSENLMNDHNCSNHKQNAAHTKWHLVANSFSPTVVKSKKGGTYRYLPLAKTTSGRTTIGTEHVFRMTTDLSQILDNNLPKIDPTTNLPYTFYLNQTTDTITVDQPSSLKNRIFIVSDLINIRHDFLPH